MKNKLLTSALCLLAFASLSLPGCAVAPQGEEVVEYVGDDPIIYDEEDKTLVPFEKMTMLNPKEATYSTPNKVILTYVNDDGRCNARRLYTWVDEVDGLEQPSTTSEANRFSLEMDFSTPRYEKYANQPLLWFIVKFAGTWAGQSDDIKIVYSDYADLIDGSGTLKLWLIPGEGSSVEICRTEEETQITKIKTAKFTDFKTIHCVSSEDKAPLWYKLYGFDRVYLDSSAAVQDANKEFYLLKEGNNILTPEFDIKLNYTARINVQYMIESKYPGWEDKAARKVYVSYEELYKTDRFNAYYNYDGDDLGVTYTPEKTTFKLWSPISASVTLRLYQDGSSAADGGSDRGSSTPMYYTGHGVWEVSIVGDMLTKPYRYYNYIVTNPGGVKVEATDPYAHAVGLNGKRGYVYDSKTEVDDVISWESVPGIWDKNGKYDISNPQDLSIYEIHVRDLTMDESWQSNTDTKRGTFDAFVEPNTSLTENFKGTNYTVSTGFSHIKELGVKAVQLLPVFDHDNEERYDKYKFNWGYNPLNYNCVEGAFSSDPADPLARIKEYKNLVKQFATYDSDPVRVIMDVVYNHVSSAPNSCFTKIMPKYYFRYNSEWAYTAGSGCANDVRTEAPMMRKYIVDSLKWWASEYKIKGFRFDLMGLIDVETIRQVRNALTAIDPDIYIYGEGWSSGGTIFDSGAVGAKSAEVYSMLYKSSSTNGYVGCFNDSARNAIRGKNDSGWADVGNKYPTWGFVDQGKGDGAGKWFVLEDMIKGIHSDEYNSEKDVGANPNQMIAYASCHDNYTVWDQMRYGMATKAYSTVDEMGPGGSSSGRKYEQPLRPNKNGEPDIGELVSASIMTHGMVMASNGVAFMQGGEEIYRTKTISGSDNDAQGYKKTPEFNELTEGGDEALMRAFPQYMNYDPKNNPEDEGYDPSAPISILCTGEVRMFKDDEYVSHNSYKMPDSVNSFKWGRKIHIGDTLTYDSFGAWKAMISLRKSTAKYDYDSLFTGGKLNSFSTWGDYGYGGALGMYIPNGIHLIMASRDGGSLGIGGQTFDYYSRDAKSYDQDTLSMNAYSLFVYHR